LGSKYAISTKFGQHAVAKFRDEKRNSNSQSQKGSSESQNLPGQIQ
jgi:hypothetical protein